eukprot:scaffold22418_cov68-Skeletonema_marinoi.AAC.1
MVKRRANPTSIECRLGRRRCRRLIRTRARSSKKRSNFEYSAAVSLVYTHGAISRSAEQNERSR